MLEGIATNVGLAYCLGLLDREMCDFVWDKTDKKLISIDHELFLEESQDREIIVSNSLTLMDFFGYKWYHNKKEKDIFTNAFLSMWDKIIKKQDEILKIFKENNFTTGTLILKRIKDGSQIPLDLIMP